MTAADLIRCSVAGCPAGVVHALFVSVDDGEIGCRFFCDPHGREAVRVRAAVRAGKAVA